MSRMLFFSYFCDDGMFTCSWNAARYCSMDHSCVLSVFLQHWSTLKVANCSDCHWYYGTVLLYSHCLCGRYKFCFPSGPDRGDSSISTIHAAKRPSAMNLLAQHISHNCASQTHIWSIEAAVLSTNEYLGANALIPVSTWVCIVKLATVVSSYLQILSSTILTQKATCVCHIFWEHERNDSGPTKSVSCALWITYRLLMTLQLLARGIDCNLCSYSFHSSSD